MLMIITDSISVLELKDLKVNLAKTKTLVSKKADRILSSSGKWHGLICRKGVGRNSIRCTQCKLWTHISCIGIIGRLSVKAVFVCGKCTGAIKTIRYSGN